MEKGIKIEASKGYRVVSFGGNQYDSLNKNIPDLTLTKKLTNSFSHPMAIYEYGNTSVLCLEPNHRRGFPRYFSKATILSDDINEVKGLVKKLRKNKMRLKEI